MKSAFAFLALFMLCLAAYPAFQLDGITVSVFVDEKGNTTIEERVDLTLTTPNTIDLYNSPILRHDLATWRDLVGVSEIRHHISGATVDIKNIRVRPQPPKLCNEFAGTCKATIFIDYNAYQLPPSNSTVASKTGLFFADKFKPRTTRYTLNTNAITLGLSESGDLALDKNTNLTIVLPKTAAKIVSQPLPVGVEFQELLQQHNKFSWRNMRLPRFEFSYEIEESLENEVFDFFTSLQRAAQMAIFGPQGLALIAIVVIILSSYVYLNFVVGKNKK